MNIAITFKNFEPSDHLRAYAERRFGKLKRFAPKSENVAMTAVLTVDKYRHKADVQFTGDGMNISAMEQSADMYATVDMVLDKLEAQLKKYAERQRENRRGRSETQAHGAPVGHAPSVDRSAAPDYTIEHDALQPKPMYVDEAVLQLDQGDEDFLVFLNPETERINIVYQRKNGNIGLIDPQTA